MEQFKKTTVIIDNVLKALFIATLVCIILVAIASVTVMVLGPTHIENGRLSYSVFGVNFVIADGLDFGGASLDGYAMVKSFMLASAGGVVTMAIILVGIKMLREILAPMKEGGPFVEGISVKMRNFGIFVIVAGVVGDIIGYIVSIILQNSFKEVISSVLADGSNYITYEHVVDGSFIIFALFIFLLSYIFKYGEELQKQLDETL